MEGGILEDEVVSMVDVLHEDDELEEEARAVLGDSDDQHCTYLSGYVKRQALYACSTCVTPDGADPGGICLACSFACHEGHTLYELYTKRNFRCDCGNRKFVNLNCKLYSHKDPENTGNKYNQNFRGVYCTCHRPYPDLEDEIEDEMIQCIVCEDWYHSRHLGNLPPAGGDFQEMICDGCMKQCSFLQAYLSISIPHQQSSIGPSQQVVGKQESEVTLDVIQPNYSEKTLKEEIKDKGGKMEEQKPSGKEVSQQEPRKSELEKPSSPKKEKPMSPSKEKPLSVNKEEASNHKHEVKEEQPANGESSDKTPPDCKLVQLQDSLTNITEEASYWHTGWRANLCTCTKCIALYKSVDVSFLTDETDTMVAYEQRGRAKRPNTSSYESGMQALQNMGRIPQVEVMHEYNDLKTELTEYLREFAQQGKVVREEDIRKFFDSLQSRKRQRVGSAGTVQYNCR